MQLPDDVRLFRDLSLLHDTALAAHQRAAIEGSISAETLKVHEKYVQGLLGDQYICPMMTKNRAKPSLFRWMMS